MLCLMRRDKFLHLFLFPHVLIGDVHSSFVLGGGIKRINHVRIDTALQRYLVIHQSTMVSAAVVIVTLTDPERQACKFLDTVHPWLPWFCFVMLRIQPGAFFHARQILNH